MNTRPLDPKEAKRLRRLTRWPQYSTVRFKTTRSGTGPYVYAIAADTEVRAFSYGKDGDMTAAGYTAGTLATDSETNLQEANKPLAGQKLEIYGISICPTPISNPGVIAQVLSKTSVHLSMNGGEERNKMGPMLFYPAGAGMLGGGPDPLAGVSLDGIQTRRDFFSNGLPGFDNYFKLPEPIMWNDVGTDSSLNILFRVNRAISITLTEVTGAAGVKAYAALADGAEGTYADFIVRLHAAARGQRSQLQ